MSIRMKSISVALVFFLVVASVLAAAPPEVHADSYDTKMIVGIGVIALVAWMARSAMVDGINEAMSTWEGRNMDELILEWGPPDYVGELPSGNYVVGYTSVSASFDPGRTTTNLQAFPLLNSATATSTTTPGSVTQYESYRLFYLNSDGIITNWSWRGRMVTPEAP